MKSKIKSVGDVLKYYEQNSLTKVPTNAKIRNCQYLAYRKAKERLMDLLVGGHTSTDPGSYIIQMATGTGKSGTIGLISTCLPIPYKRVLVVTPSDGLRTQLRQNLDVCITKSDTFWAKIGLWPQEVTIRICSKANDMPEPTRKGGRFVTITTVQLLHSYRRSQGANLQRYYDLVIFDEGHKKPSQEWDETIDNLNVPVLLMTATPYRSDGRSLRSEIIYRYTFQDALSAGEKILRSVRFHNLDFRANMKQGMQAIESKLCEIENTWNSVDYSPKAIIRAGSADEVKTITNTLYKSGYDVIGVHSTFKDARVRRLTSSKTGIPASARYIIHQHMLLEGYDDPAIAIAVFLEKSEDARVFVQQTGRAVRRITALSDTIPQQAHIFSPNKKSATAIWISYCSFEQAPDQYVYRGGEFLPKLNAQGLEIGRMLNFSMAVQIRTGFTSNESNRRKTYNEIQNWIRRQSDFRNLIHDKGEGRGLLPWMVFIFEKISSPKFLNGTSFENLKLEMMLITFSKHYVFIQSSIARFPTMIQELDLVDSSSLVRIVPKADLNIGSMQLKNIVDAIGTVRTRSFWADNANRHLSPSRDGTFAPHSLRWWNEYDKINETVSLNSARYSSNEKLDLDTFLEWCADLDEKLRSDHSTHNVFNTLAKKSNQKPGDPYLIRIEIPDDAIVKDHNGDALKSTSSFLYFQIQKGVGTLSGLDSKHDGRLQIDVSFDSSKGRYDLKWEIPDEFLTISHKSAINIDLLKWIREKKRASVLTSNGVCYVSGSLYEQRQPERVHFLPILCQASIYGKTTSETTKKKSKRNWPQKTVFGVFEQHHVGSSVLFGDFDLVICDDGANEFADFVCLNRSNRRLVFVHCKWATGPRLQIDDLYVVLGQAIKNIDHMWHKPDVNTCTRWRTGKHPTTRLRARLGTFTPADEDMFIDHNVTRETWVIQPSFDVTQFLTAIRNFDQAKVETRKMAYLLDQASIALNGRGIHFRFFGS